MFKHFVFRPVAPIVFAMAAFALLPRLSVSAQTPPKVMDSSAIAQSLTLNMTYTPEPVPKPLFLPKASPKNSPDLDAQIPAQQIFIPPSQSTPTTAPTLSTLQTKERENPSRLSLRDVIRVQPAPLPDFVYQSDHYSHRTQDW